MVAQYSRLKGNKKEDFQTRLAAPDSSIHWPPANTAPRIYGKKKEFKIAGIPGVRNALVARCPHKGSRKLALRLGANLA